MSEESGVRETRLDSGLRVITEQVPGMRSFSVGFFVPVGSRHEVPTLAGASHFLEHLLFKGTRRRSAEEISVAIDSVGGDINAYTTKEHTCFYARVLDADADLAVDVLSDMITSAVISSADVDAERAIILDEIAMHADDPAEVAQELIATAIFGEQTLGAPVIGSAASVATLSRDQVVRHWRRHYQPDRLVVAAAGHVDHDRLLAALAPLGDRPPTGLRRAQRPVVVGSGPGVISVVRRLEQVTAVLGFPAPGLFDRRRYALGLLSLIIGGGMSSRLFVEVRERRGLTYGIDAGETAFTDAGLWTVEWQCAPARVPEILRLVRETVLDVAEHGVLESELVRARGQMRGQTLLAYESPTSRMSRLGANALVGDDRSLTDLLDCYDAVDADEVRRVAADVLTQPPVLALVGPRVASKRLDSLLADWPG